MPNEFDLFAEARTLLGGKVIPILYFEPSAHDTRTFPDPAYDALRKVVEGHIYRGGALLNSPDSMFIQAKAYWKQAPDGALEGALIRALYPLRDRGADGLRDRLLSMIESRLIGEQGDIRIPAMQAVVEWLRETHGKGTRSKVSSKGAT